MAHPKRRQSTHRQGIRRSHLALDEVQLNRCSHCGAAIRPHRVCDNCGWYGFDKGGEGGSDVLERDDF